MQYRTPIAVVNFPTRQIGKFMPEAVKLAFADLDGAAVLFQPDESFK
jgi:tRNA-binding protein